MRMNNIPRGIPTERSVAEQIELGVGGSDRRIEHVAPILSGNIRDDRERRHFQNLEKQDWNPENAPSQFHDYQPKPREENIVKQEVETKVLAQGEVVNALMMKEGAHLEIKDAEDTIFYVFSPQTPLVARYSKIQVIETITKTVQAYKFREDQTFSSETHDISVVEMEEDIVSDENENEA